MEGKTVLGVLIMSLVVITQIQVDAKLCCPITYEATYCNKLSLGKCAIAPECQLIDNDKCPYLRNPVQVEPKTLCCPTTYNATYCNKLSPGICAIAPECQIITDKDTCPYLGNSVQAEAKKLCCPTTLTAKCNKVSIETCAKTPECQIIIVKDHCPYLGNPGAINEYCKLGCASSVCDAISTLQIFGEANSIREEVVNEAVGHCNNACSAFCTKGSTLEIA